MTFFGKYNNEKKLLHFIEFKKLLAGGIPYKTDAAYQSVLTEGRSAALTDTSKYCT